MLCEDAVCVKLPEHYCRDPDGDDPGIKGYAYGTNPWNDGLVNWGDHCSETTDGGSTEKGVYLHEASCLEDDDGNPQVKYLDAVECETSCVEGACLNGKVKGEEKKKQETQGKEGGKKPVNKPRTLDEAKERDVKELAVKTINATQYLREKKAGEEKQAGENKQESVKRRQGKKAMDSAID